MTSSASPGTETNAEYEKALAEQRKQVDDLERQKTSKGFERENKKQIEEFRRRARLEDEIERVKAAPGSERGQSLREARGLVDAEQDRLDILRKQLDVLQVQAEGRKTVNPIGRVETEALSLDEQIENKAEQSKIRTLIAQSEAQLQDRILQTEIEQLNIIRKQEEERRKSKPKNANKELGGLDDLELIRQRITAGQIQSGEFKPLNEGQFLGLDQGTRQSLLKSQEAFPGKRIVPDLTLGFGQDAFREREFGESPRTVLDRGISLGRRREQPQGPIDPGPVIPQPPPAPHSPAPPPTINVGVNFDSFESHLERISMAASLAVEAKVIPILEKYAQRIESVENRVGKGGFRPTVRT